MELTIKEIKTEYFNGECDDITTIERLEEWCGYSSKDAEELVDIWESNKK